MLPLIFFSNNAHKAAEVQAILGQEVLAYTRFLGRVEVVEGGQSFEENAHLKAQTLYPLLADKFQDFCVLAEDSGLCVQALGGYPGIYSARFASIKESAKAIMAGNFTPPSLPASDTENNNKLLACLDALGLLESPACFVCVAALCGCVGGQEVSQAFRGECWGKIVKASLKSNAFGYDPLFIPKGYHTTMDTLKEKNRISHRFLALQQVQNFLKDLVP
ncbi:Nucleoside 5-triphosphatase RdgB (dHAPTP, dITP, XTP-specific) [Helicobacter heilmannii]|uniref:non-canonical purine NTP pyrophosphatase n=1 Tax=Helicobacter heilmannii TaxID=35817 RepID=UPI0006A19666|nr:non-canonical purine NTP pyrophosphatase [Helicobacter heilmannii]CRF50493.1 Nucleoside 5-triphosphatase RdgB (dHAPTP, dITP, XTP-specific) [Helicobacter heilmannii]